MAKQPLWVTDAELETISLWLAYLLDKYQLSEEDLEELTNVYQQTKTHLVRRTP